MDRRAARGAPSEASQREVADELLARATLRGEPDRGRAGAAATTRMVLEAFRLANRAMAMAARQRRAQEQGIDPDGVEPPAWRPFQLAFS